MLIIFTKKGLTQALLLMAAFFICCGFAKGLLHENTVPTGAMEGQTGYVCIVIDDFGYDGEGTEEMLALDVPITAAVMPFSAHSAEDALKVLEAGKEAIIHMPMESNTGKPEWVGDKGVFTSMTDEEIKARVEEALEIVPNAVGINNHMGSKIMEDERSLAAVMRVAAEHELIFVDSRTTPKTKSKEVCEAAGVRLINRSVFLDSTDDIQVVKQQLLKAADMALRTGNALAIGHVGPEGGLITAKAIGELAPELEHQGVVFVTLTEFAEIVGAE